MFAKFRISVVTETS